jgi:starch-binding outer membrane protein, SusD/RagB family
MKTVARYTFKKPLSCLLTGAIMLFFSSCTDFVQVDNPRTEVTSPAVYADDATATAAVLGIYAEMVGTNFFASASVAVLTGLSSDEFVRYEDSFQAFEENSLTSGVSKLRGELWQPGFKYIYYANAVIEGLRDNKAISPDVDSLLLGEAYFVRAFCMFHLTNLFGPLPPVTTTDFRDNASLKRVSQEEIYALVEQDLLIARTYLPGDFGAGDGERIRPTTWAASALLARLYLYSKRWAAAETEAGRLIDASGGLFSLPAISEVFTPASTEAIWQLKPPEGMGPWEADIFVANPDSYPNYVGLRIDMLHIHDEEDARRQWIQYTRPLPEDTVVYSYKYTTPLSPTEYHTEFRLAEQYLIRAEARAQQDDWDGALADVDAVRDRAGIAPLLGNGTTWTRSLVLASILDERRKELFAEGHRWFDLVRMEQAQTVLSAINGKDWQTDVDILYPIPESEIKNNSNLEPQNHGY